MPCIKTGFQAYLEPHSVFVRGDAYELYGVYYFRICFIQRGPFIGKIHFHIRDWENWFDEQGIGVVGKNSTMICSAEQCSYHGPEGV